ncbi:MAG: alcohol dehydrogenase catalytic domain-containing protein [Chloroflexi bacterium]|nr:alcohol dehydrogenase catalytic domain-containing protein [Chloroflexota bacterium]
MKAVRLVQAGKPLVLQEISEPEIGPDDVLVQVMAAGICHSDVHYRAGISPVHPLPMTLGHEVAGVIKKLGSNVRSRTIGERICLHYMVTCGECMYCNLGSEQFCISGQMLGKNRDGGYAEYIVLPARNAFPLPNEIPFEQGAIMMCSSASSFHALRKSRLRAGETVAIFGIGGLGMSAVQLAQGFGALEIYAVDINTNKLKLAEKYGAIPINGAEVDPVEEIKKLTNQRGVDVAIELIGLPLTIRQAIESLTVFGRGVMVGLNDTFVKFDPYRELICREAEIIGSADHLAHELPTLIELVRRGSIDLSGVVSDTIALDPDAINKTMDRLEEFGEDLRIVITP